MPRSQLPQLNLQKKIATTEEHLLTKTTLTSVQQQISMLKDVLEQIYPKNIFFFRLNAASKSIRRYSDSANLQSLRRARLLSDFRSAYSELGPPLSYCKGVNLYIYYDYFVSYFHNIAHATLLFISQKLLPQLPPLPTSHCLLLLICQRASSPTG